MSIIALDVAKQHLRMDTDDADDQIQRYLDGAEEAAAKFLNRAIYTDVAAMDAARVVAPTALSDGLASIETQTTAAVLINDCTVRTESLCVIDSDRRDLIWNYRAAMAGIVMTPSIQDACLLLLGASWANREDVVAGQVMELPGGARALLWPFRTGLGV